MTRQAWRLAASCAVVCAAFGASQAAAAISIDVLSSKPQLVTGGDALVKISGASAAPSVTVGGKDMSAAFKKDAGGAWVGLVDGLHDGDNALVAKAGADQATVTLVNHGINDALFSGPQQKPWVCENEAWKLEPAKDTSCAAPSVVNYYYRDKKGAWKPFDAANRPGDIGTAKIDGNNVPLIIRQEMGIINRGTYVISILHDPDAGPVPTPTDRGGSAWTGKLAMSFGPGVGAGYRSGRNIGEWNAGGQYVQDTTYFDGLITRGYAFASSSIAVFGTQPNDVLSAESTAKVKEHFIEEFGAPMFTIGQGPSGGSMQQNLIANAYPGILDGIMPERLYADELTFLQPLFDCELLVNVFKEGDWTREQLNAVSGKYWGYCVSNGARYPRARPTGCDGAVYDYLSKLPENAGKSDEQIQGLVNCTFAENMVNIFGRDANGVARNPYGNEGVQYGLKALNDGVITWAQFLDINSRIGGHDANGNIVPQRQVGDEQAIKNAYATGRVNEMNGGNKDVAYIDVRTYADGDPFGRGDANVDVHDRYHSDIAKARMQKYNGTLANYVQILTANGPGTTNSPDMGTARQIGFAYALNGLDTWLTAVVHDMSNKSRAEKIAANRPKDLVDTCFAAASGSTLGKVDAITDPAKCKEIFPSTFDPRIVAGAPATDDVFKCQLKPVDVKDYKVAPNATQLADLKKIFATGVCDYSKPGIGQDQKITTWASFKGDGTFSGI